MEVFDEKELLQHLDSLGIFRDALIPASEHKNQRRTLSRQMEKVKDRLKKLKNGTAIVDRDAPRRCRTCTQSTKICDGKCWGFWKTAAESSSSSSVPGGEEKSEGSLSLSEEKCDDIIPVAVGDMVQPGQDWNPIRLGETSDRDGNRLVGEVTGIKSWAGSSEFDCVSVLWKDGIVRGRNQVKVQSQIYRWGVLAVDQKTRIYDVQKVVCPMINTSP